MKDKLIQALTIEYEAVYLINLEDDTFEALKALKGSKAMNSTNCWSEAAESFLNECSEDSREIARLFSKPDYIKTALSKDNTQSCTFRHITSDSRWRRATVQTIERKGKNPSIVLMTVSIIDKFARLKESMLQRVLYDSNGNGIKGDKDDSNMSIYKMVLNSDAENAENILFDGIKILLVEDSAILRQMSKEILEDEGAIVTEAEDGRRAIEIVTAGNRFDFIIMDILMPVVDGITATKEIVEYQKNSDIKTPILGLTADASEEQRNKIIESGAYACLSKPLNPKEMSKVFISCMKKNSMLLEEKMAEINLLANTDMLTQTGNIVAYTHDIGELSRNLNKLDNSIAIAICDLDNLKTVNDTYGHDIGDIYIKNCCKLISSTFVDSALYRVGGDEFALIVKGNELSKIDSYVSKLNKESSAISSVKEIVDGKASVSCGYAVYDSTRDQSLSDTMKRADVDMYETKMLHKKWAETYSRINKSEK